MQELPMESVERLSGVLMATEQRTSEEALDRLRELALTSGEPMRTVAEWVLTERPPGVAPSVPERDEEPTREEA